ncbi:integrase, catalytic region, zinc finger, CCHC-type containing protein [Tanacetum coccineum]
MVRFGNDHFGAIMGYGDYVIGESVISRVYYVEGLGHNLFFVGQFCDSDLEVAFRKHSCCVRDMNGVDLIKGSRGFNLPMRIQTINGKKYILVIIDDYSRFTWVKFLRSKDETSEVVIKFLKQIQVGLNKTVRNIRTDNGTEFVNKDFTYYYERVGIFHQKIVLRTPQQNDVVERRNRTLVEAARTMLIFSKALMFLWAEAMATAVFGALCYPINDSEDLGKLQPIADIGIFVGYAPSRKGIGSSCSSSSSISSTTQLYTSSTTIDQDAPSPSHSPSSSALQSPSLHQGIAAEPTLMEDNPFAPTDNDPFINVFALDPRSEASSSRDLSSTESPYVS